MPANHLIAGMARSYKMALPMGELQEQDALPAKLSEAAWKPRKLSRGR